MSFQFIQIIQILIYLLLGFFAWKIKNKKVKGFIIFILLIVFLFNPIRFKQEGMSKNERRYKQSHIELPERITDSSPSFEQKQQTEMSKLKTQSKEITKNETN